MGYNNGHFWTFSKQEERKIQETTLLFGYYNQFSHITFFKKTGLIYPFVVPCRWLYHLVFLIFSNQKQGLPSLWVIMCSKLSFPQSENLQMKHFILQLSTGLRSLWPFMNIVFWSELWIKNRCQINSWILFHY